MRSWPSQGNIQALSGDTEQNHEESRSSHTTNRCSKQPPAEYESRTSIPGRVKLTFSTQQCPDLLWGPSSLQSNGYRGLIPRK
jgi:hypothetical protein